MTVRTATVIECDGGRDCPHEPAVFGRKGESAAAAICEAVARGWAITTLGDFCPDCAKRLGLVKEEA